MNFAIFLSSSTTRIVIRLLRHRYVVQNIVESIMRIMTDIMLNCVKTRTIFNNSDLSKACFIFGILVSIIAEGKYSDVLAKRTILWGGAIRREKAHMLQPSMLISLKAFLKSLLWAHKANFSRIELFRIEVYIPSQIPPIQLCLDILDYLDRIVLLGGCHIHVALRSLLVGYYVLLKYILGI